jgi:hypothetical protein
MLFEIVSTLEPKGLLQKFITIHQSQQKVARAERITLDFFTDLCSIDDRFLI